MEGGVRRRRRSPGRSFLRPYRRLSGRIIRPPGHRGERDAYRLLWLLGAGARPDQCSEASCHSSGWTSRQQSSSVTVVVISSNGKDDRPVESLEVKAPVGWETSQIRTGGLATRQAVAVANQSSPEIRAPRETDCGILGSAQPFGPWRRPMSTSVLDRNDERTPRGQRGRHVRKECAAKARNHSWVA